MRCAQVPGHLKRVAGLVIDTFQKPMVKVRTGSIDCACISATMVDEPVPPDRNAPRRDVGTAPSLDGDRQWRLQLINRLPFIRGAITGSCGDQYGLSAGMLPGDGQRQG